jgi:hypothetical protein
MVEQIRLLQADIQDRCQEMWHSQLLRRMTLDVKSIRPPVISQDPYPYLNELRSFRHLFRNAYLLEFDPDRLTIILQHAGQLEQRYKKDMDNFLQYLDQIAQSD